MKPRRSELELTSVLTALGSSPRIGGNPCMFLKLAYREEDGTLRTLYIPTTQRDAMSVEWLVGRLT